MKHNIGDIVTFKNASGVNKIANVSLIGQKAKIITIYPEENNKILYQVIFLGTNKMRTFYSWRFEEMDISSAVIEKVNIMWERQPYWRQYHE